MTSPDHEEDEGHALGAVLHQVDGVLVLLGRDRRGVQHHRQQVHLDTDCTITALQCSHWKINLIWRV